MSCYFSIMYKRTCLETMDQLNTLSLWVKFFHWPFSWTVCPCGSHRRSSYFHYTVVDTYSLCHQGYKHCFEMHSAQHGGSGHYFQIHDSCLTSKSSIILIMAWRRKWRGFSYHVRLFGNYCQPFCSNSVACLTKFNLVLPVTLIHGLYISIFRVMASNRRKLTPPKHQVLLEQR